MNKITKLIDEVNRGVASISKSIYYTDYVGTYIPCSQGICLSLEAITKKIETFYFTRNMNEKTYTFSNALYVSIRNSI